MIHLTNHNIADSCLLFILRYLQNSQEYCDNICVTFKEHFLHKLKTTIYLNELYATSSNYHNWI